MSRLLTLREAAERLRLSEWRVRQMVKAGQLRPVRLTPGKLLFTEAALEEAVRDAEQGAAPAPAQGRGKQTTPDLQERRGTP